MNSGFVAEYNNFYYNFLWILCYTDVMVLNWGFVAEHKKVFLYSRLESVERERETFVAMFGFQLSV